MKYDVIRSYWPAPQYDTATLNLDFTTGVLDSRLTFTRAAGTATYINSSGYVTTAAANVARFDYDPVTLAPRGLLIEGSAINLMTYSEDQGNNSTWNAYSTSVTRTTGQTDPENTTTATKILFDATSADAVISRSVTISNATAYTISVWMRADSGTVSNVRFGRAATASGAIFPTLTTTWQRVQLAFTSSGTSDGIEIRVLTSGSPKTATIHIWGAQLEAGSGASSYIPTVASQVTRNPDYLLSTSSGARTEFSIDDLAAGTSALNAHTVFWTYGRDPNSKRDYPASLYARTNANTERIDLRDFSGTTVEVGTQTRTVQAVTVGTASIVKIAVAQSTSAYPSSAINGTSATLTSGVIDSALGLQWVQLCNSSAVASSFNPIWARQLKVYPTALTAAQLQTLTAL